MVVAFLIKNVSGVFSYDSLYFQFVFHPIFNDLAASEFILQLFLGIVRGVWINGGTNACVYECLLDFDSASDHGCFAVAVIDNIRTCFPMRKNFSFKKRVTVRRRYFIEMFLDQVV